MDDSNYETGLIKIVGKAAYAKHQEALGMISNDLRSRVIICLKLGLNIPNTLAHVQKASALPDENFGRYIRYVAANLV